MTRTALLFLAFLAASPLHAQTVQLRAGGSLARLTTFEQALKPESTTGFTGGLYLDLPAGPVALRTGATWVSKGARVSLPIEATSVAIELNAEYVEVPALLLIGTNAGNDSPKAFAAAGVENQCETGAAKRFDVSGAIGAGVAIPLTFSLSLGMEFMYLHGLGRDQRRRRQGAHLPRDRGDRDPTAMKRARQLRAADFRRGPSSTKHGWQCD